MTAYLLDVNVLLALSDRMHAHHEAAHRWLAEKGCQCWATCPLTENGFVRVSSHPNYPNRPGDVHTVMAILRRLCEGQGHEFWIEDTSILDIVRSDAIITHTQVTDLYLVGLAVRNKGKLATLDRRIPAHAVVGGQQALEVIPVP